VQGGHGSAKFRGGFQNRLGNRVFVESGLTFASDQRERAGKIRVTEELASLGCLIPRQENTPALRIRNQPLTARLPIVIHDLGNGVAIAGEKDGGLEEVAPRELAEAAMKLGPPVDRPRNRD